MGATPAEFELQQEVQRFTTEFTDRIVQATEALEGSSRPDVRAQALRKNLAYISSAMEIASGPLAEINLLDMIVFVRLSESALHRHWIPELYGDEGAELAEVFARSEQTLAELAARALSPDQRQQLANVVDEWLAQNPNQLRVEGIRLSDFAHEAGSVAAQRAARAKGLLSSVKVATRTADQALLLSERLLFLLHRVPSLWRFQARLGAREMLSDAVVELAEGPHAPLVRVKRVARRGLVLAGLLGGAGLLLSWLNSMFGARRQPRHA
jgi:hypothetical protein